MNRQKTWAQRIALTVLCLLPLFTQWQLRAGLPYDDALITLVYARSLSEGHGFVYNVGVPHLGTTAPLQAILMALAHRIFPQIELYALAGWVGATWWLLTIVIVYQFGKRVMNATAGFALATLFAAFPFFAYTTASEYPLLIFLCVAAIFCSGQKRLAWAGLLLGCAFVARADALILAGLVGLTVWFENRRPPWRLLATFLLVALPWVAYAWWQFGNPLAATFSLKQTQRLLNLWLPLEDGVWQWFTTLAFPLQLWAASAVLAGAWGAFLLERNRQRWAVLVPTWTLAYAAAYLFLDVPFRFWYVLPFFVGCAIIASLALGHARAQKLRAATIGLALLQLVMILGGTFTLANASNTTNLGAVSTKVETYTRVNSWLVAHAPSNARIASFEVGLLGYQTQREIVDLLGHVTPGIEPFLQRKDYVGILKTMKPDFYLRYTAFDNWPMSRELHESDYFLLHYAPVIEFRKLPTKPVVIYRYRD